MDIHRGTISIVATSEKTEGRTEAPLTKLLAELLHKSIQESEFSSQNVAMRWRKDGVEAVHSEFWILNTTRAKHRFARASMAWNPRMSIVKA